uniref:Deoxynucleotidyltransferase, terminal n=1 Tax=Cyprinus carpio TaxID=7962 RepID=A0A8C1RKV6_CYPCA
MFPTALPTRKRRRPEVAFVGGREEVKFRDVTLFLVERRMGKSRRNFLSNLARSKGFLCVSSETSVSLSVMHLKRKRRPNQEGCEPEPGRCSGCDLINPSDSLMKRFVACLTSLSSQEIFECGSSSRVEEILNDERYRTMKLFSSVFGVGPKTSENWFFRGLRTFEQVLSEPSIRLNRMQTAGELEHGFCDISNPVSRTEANALKILVEEAVICVNPSATVSITGGFSR